MGTVKNGRTQINQYSWHNNANVMWVDQLPEWDFPRDSAHTMKMVLPQTCGLSCKISTNNFPNTRRTSSTFLVNPMLAIMCLPSATGFGRITKLQISKFLLQEWASAMA